MASNLGHLYRLDPLDRALIGPLSRRQVAVLIGAAMFWLLTMLAGLGAIPGGAAMLLGFVISIPPLAGQPIVEWLPVWGGWLLRGRWARRWMRPLHLTTGGPLNRPPSLPSWLGGLRIVAHPEQRWAAIHDTANKALTAHLQIAGTGFTTLAAADMDFLLSAWGQVFGAVPPDDGLIRITWSDVARRVPLVAHDDWAAQLRPADRDLDDYRAFVAETTAMRHDLILTVTVRVPPLRGRDAQQAAMDRLQAAVTIVSDALRDARLNAHGPLSSGEIAYLMRAGLDPTDLEPPGGRRPNSLVQRLGMVPVGAAGPMIADAAANHLHVDSVVHRSFWVESWPNTPQGPDWFEPLLSADLPDVVQRVFTLVVEPLPDTKAINEIRHAAARHGGEQVAAAEGRTRWDAFKERNQAAVLDREQEVAAGHTPVAYAGLMTITVADREHLHRASRAVQRRCERHRVFLRPLWGRMETGFAAAMPIGLGLSREPW